MAKRKLVFVFCCTILLGATVDTVFGKCFDDQKQNCIPADVNDSSWNSTARFLLFTRKNPKTPEFLHMCNGNLPQDTNFNPNNKLYVLIPGFVAGTCEVDMIPEIKDEWLKRGDFNVILIDCSKVYGMDFMEAFETVEIVAKVVVRVLKNIQKRTKLKNENIHLVGHSLGCHTCGIVGQHLKIPRITGLDPAGVLFLQDTPIDKRLDASDADLVDVIHTNAGKGIPYLGANFPLGDADFFVNGGSIQPSCSATAWKSLKRMNLFFALGVASQPYICSHAQSVEYYRLSINPGYNRFYGWPCKSNKKFKSGKCTGPGATNVTMGFDFEESFTEEERQKEFPRKYYVQTASKWPFFTNSTPTANKADVQETGFYARYTTAPET